jgi:hypothetical protein
LPDRESPLLKAIVAATVLTLSAGTAAASGGSSRPATPSVPDVNGVVAHVVGDYLVRTAFDDAVAQAAALDAWLATLYTAPIPASTGYTTSSARAGAGHSDAWWHGVAICEQGGRNDPYFGYFSFMDGSQGGRSWADQVAAGNALLASVGSESPAWAPSCVAAGYAASPGG